MLRFQNTSLDEGDRYKKDNKRCAVKKAPGRGATCVGQEVKLSTELLAELLPLCNSQLSWLCFVQSPRLRSVNQMLAELFLDLLVSSFRKTLRGVLSSICNSHLSFWK